jgi:two-component system response regulator DesR
MAMPIAEGRTVNQVLIIEDHPLVAEATRDVLTRSSSQIQCHISANALDALNCLSDPNFDWFRIFLDLDVPGAHGLSLAREIQFIGMHTKCCIVTALDKPQLITEVESLGFLGYIMKATPYAEFVSSIKCIMDGHATFARSQRAVSSTSIRLTRRQTQILDLVRRGLHSKEIASKLFLSEGTVNNHIAAATKMLNATGRGHAVAKAIELGLIDNYSSEEASRLQAN